MNSILWEVRKIANIKCIDVSTWQGKVDWKKVRADGYDHAILRAGYGRYAEQMDEQFERNYDSAKTAGVKIGVYWYSYADGVATAKREATACLKVLEGKSLELPVFFDMEENTQKSLGKSVLTQMAKTFCDEIIRGGFRAGVYSNPDWFRNYLDYTELRSKYYIWLAHYATQPAFECDVWQYSSEGSVSGISGNVDLNRIYNGELPLSENESLETAGVQALLRQAYAQGIVKTFVKPIDNKVGRLTTAAIKEAKAYLGYDSEDISVTLKFISDLEHQVNLRRIARDKSYEEKVSQLLEDIRSVGDINADGDVDIKDVTALQKQLAGLE